MKQRIERRTLGGHLTVLGWSGSDSLLSFQSLTGRTLWWNTVRGHFAGHFADTFSDPPVSDCFVNDLSARTLRRTLADTRLPAGRTLRGSIYILPAVRCCPVPLPKEAECASETT